MHHDESCHLPSPELAGDLLQLDMLGGGRWCVGLAMGSIHFIPTHLQSGQLKALSESATGQPHPCVIGHLMTTGENLGSGGKKS